MVNKMMRILDRSFQSRVFGSTRINLGEPGEESSDAGSRVKSGKGGPFWLCVQFH